MQNKRKKKSAQRIQLEKGNVDGKRLNDDEKLSALASPRKVQCTQSEAQKQAFLGSAEERRDENTEACLLTESPVSVDGGGI